MLGYVCKYTPMELFEAMDTEITRLEPSVTDFNHADTLMHANICSYTKAVLEDVMEHDYEGVILTTCCDSIRRLYDTLKSQFPDKFFFLLDIPRKFNDFAVTLYERQLKQMLTEYEAFSGKTLDLKRFVSMMQNKAALKKQENTRMSSSAVSEKGNGQKLNIGIMGARCNNEIRQLLVDRGANLLFDLTCTGLARDFSITEDQALHSYAAALLNQIPCMRMLKAANREHFLDGFTDRLDGIIYHTVKFCDSYSYEYADFRQRLDLPILLVETDSTRQCAGQVRTRVEAFMEELKVKKGLSLTGEKQMIKRKGDTVYTLGIDSGSTSTNAVILDENRQIKAFSVVRTGAKSSQSADAALADVLKKAGLNREDISLIVSTGYGRVSIPFADKNVTEISCHGKGAHLLFPDVHTILDIGGQDTKGIFLKNGRVMKFVMNDKCSAGTGKFLEIMTNRLGLTMEELSELAGRGTPTVISSMCTVFAESEVISLIGKGTPREDIAYGVIESVVTKVVQLISQVPSDQYFLTGGLCEDPYIINRLSHALEAPVESMPLARYAGAIGAALMAEE